MSVGLTAEGRTCSYCEIDIPKELYNQILYCAPMAGCFNFCSEECYQKWYRRVIKRRIKKDSKNGE
jgi:hypothetical protein